MRLTNRRHGSKIELQMTSMIDVVFLLLIFFMVTSSFHKAERELDPAVKLQRAAATRTTDLAPTIVDVMPAESGFVYRLGGRELRTAPELIDVLRQLENKLDGAIVRVSDEAPFDMAATAIQSCKTAGFNLVSYVPLPKAN